MSSIFHLRQDWLPSCTPMMTLIMMDITMAKRSIIYEQKMAWVSYRNLEISSMK